MNKSALDIIKQIANEVEDVHPTNERMVREVQMMGFKIRQTGGAESILQSFNFEIIKSLWKIGRIDQIIGDSFHELDDEEQDRVLEYLYSLEERTGEKLHQTFMPILAKKKHQKTLKIEVFKSFDDQIIH